MNDNAVEPSQTNSSTGMPAESKTTRIKTLAILAYIVLAIVIGGLVFLNQQSRGEISDANNKASDLERQLNGTKRELEDTKKELSGLKDANGENNIKKDQFQSVFLKSGQVYFGKITKITTTQITLENIYYLQENGESLVKLGEEVHGPEDVMYIERQNVEFWENLKPDSEVSRAIKEYEAQNP